MYTLIYTVSVVIVIHVCVRTKLGKIKLFKLNAGGRKKWLGEYCIPYHALPFRSSSHHRIWTEIILCKWKSKKKKFSCSNDIVGILCLCDCEKYTHFQVKSEIRLKPFFFFLLLGGYVSAVYTKNFYWVNRFTFWSRQHKQQPACRKMNAFLWRFSFFFNYFMQIYSFSLSVIFRVCLLMKFLSFFNRYDEMLHEKVPETRHAISISFFFVAKSKINKLNIIFSKYWLCFAKVKRKPEIVFNSFRMQCRKAPDFPLWTYESMWNKPHQKRTQNW